MDSDDDYYDDGDLYDDSGNESPEVEDGSEEEENFIMDAGFEDEPSGSSSQKIEEEYHFEVVLNLNKNIRGQYDSLQVLSTEDIVSHMVENIKEVSSITQIPATTIRILLNHFKWDKEKLMERYYTEDQETMFEEAQVISPNRSRETAESLRSQRPSSAGTASVLDCDICCLSLPRQMMTGLECGHLFCTQCWTEYLTTKIVDEGASQMIECPGSCNIVVDDQTVMTLITDARVKLKYQHLITNSFVQCNRLLKWCPSPDCSNAVKVQVLANFIMLNLPLHKHCFVSACGSKACKVSLHPLFLLQLQRKLARPCPVPPDQEVDQEVRRRQ